MNRIRDEIDQSSRLVSLYPHKKECCIAPPPPYKFPDCSSKRDSDKVSSSFPSKKSPVFDVKPKSSATGNAAPHRPLEVSRCISSRVPSETMANELQSRFMIDHVGKNLRLERSDFLLLAGRQRVNALKNNPEQSPQGSTCSNSPRSSISTLASSHELRQLVYSPFFNCSCTPSPALVGCAECRGSCTTSPSRSFVCSSPAETVIIHDRADSTQGHRRYINTNPFNTNTGLNYPASCNHFLNGPTVNYHHTPQRRQTPPLISNRTLNKNSRKSYSSASTVPVISSSLAARKTFSPAFETVAETPTPWTCYPAMNAQHPARSRDISAAVFSQPCSEDYEEPPPPPYKPPPAPAVVTKLRLPTTITTGKHSRSAEVEKKLEELTAQLASKNLDEEEEYDDEEYFGQCYLCGDRVVGVENACQAMQQLYHSSCFICSICGRALRGKAFYHVKGKIMCEEDYLYSGFQISADKCAACGHLIMDMILQALGKTFHPGCFRCCICNKALDGVPFTLDVEGKIYCIEDYRDVFAPKCARCMEPIIPVEDSGETVRVVSMERDFHVDCYACEDCGLQLTDNPKERRCYPLDGHLLCHGCHNKRREKNAERSRAQQSQQSSRSSSVVANSLSGTPCGLHRDTKPRSSVISSSNICSRLP